MPIDRGLIDQQLQALGATGWWDYRELRDLPAVLHDEERILAISRGKIARVRWLRRPWLIVVTDRRLVCVRSGGRTSWRQIELTASQITRVSLRVGLFRGRVLVSANDHTYRLLVPRADAYKLLTVLSSLSSTGRQALQGGFGPTRMVRRVIDHVLALPAAAFDPSAPGAAAAQQQSSTALIDQRLQLDQRVQTLEEQVQELQRQVDFLESLLRQRQTQSADMEEFRPI